MRNIPVFLIGLYQKTLSPDHGWTAHFYPYGFCRHHPTCSEFARQTLLSEGTLKGTMLTLQRLLNCHPWAQPNDRRLREIIRTRAL